MNDVKHAIFSISQEIIFLEAETQRLDSQRRLLAKQENLSGELARYQWLDDLFQLNEQIRRLEERKEELRKRRFNLIREFIDEIENKIKGGKNEEK